MDHNISAVGRDARRVAAQIRLLHSPYVWSKYQQLFSEDLFDVQHLAQIVKNSSFSPVLYGTYSGTLYYLKFQYRSFIVITAAARQLGNQLR